MDKIIIQQLKVETIIGVYAQERQKPQTLFYDIELDVNQIKASQHDQLIHTIDYAAVCQTIHDFVTTTEFQLLETLAEQTAQQLLQHFNIKKCTITIYKKPFDMPNVNSVAVKIERERR